MVTYRDTDRRAIINSTIALKFRLQIQQRAVKESRQDVVNMKRQNKQRIDRTRKFVRRQRIEPGKSQAKKWLNDVLRRSKLRVAVPTRGLQLEVKKLNRLVKKIHRLYRAGKINKIL